MSEARSAAVIARDRATFQRVEASRASRAAWDSFLAADAKSSRLLTAANEAGDLSARLLSAALDAERVAVAAEAAFADAVKRFPQEGD